MLAFWLLALVVVQFTTPAEAPFGVNVGGGVGIGVGIGIGSGGGVWIGGGNNRPTPPGSTSRLGRAFIALQAWKSAISDDPTGVLTTWVGPNVCSYKGVFCAGADSTMPETGGAFVAGIDLNHANLKGVLVKELSYLTEMSLFHLNSNRFTGTVPFAFKDLYYLQELDLSNNLFSGPFPAITLYLPNLIYLDLRFNAFSGPIPEDLFNKKLDAIFINNNQFDGQIPQNLGNSPASVINLANNKFTGSIPATLGLLGSNLKEILFLNNQLTGCIPEGIGLFSEIQVFDASFNSLMGHIPDTLSCLNQIEVLNLAHNKLSGLLPDPICSLRKLVNFSISFNFFSGFSQECTKLFFRNVGFDISANCIPGRGLQRPQPDCMAVPGGGLSCLRVPSIVKPLICATLGERTDKDLASSPP